VIAGVSEQSIARAVRTDLLSFGQEAKTALRAHVLRYIADRIGPLLDKQYELAMAGDTRLLISLTDRIADRPTEHHEVTAHTVPLFSLSALDDISTADPLKQIPQNTPETMDVSE